MATKRVAWIDPAKISWNILAHRFQYGLLERKVGKMLTNIPLDSSKCARRTGGALAVSVRLV
jgi:hypothetical protein